MTCLAIRGSASSPKNRILVQSQGGIKFQPGGILWYFEDLKREPNEGFGPKDIFEIPSIYIRVGIKISIRRPVCTSSQRETEMEPLYFSTSFLVMVSPSFAPGSVGV